MKKIITKIKRKLENNNLVVTDGLELLLTLNTF